MRSKSSKYSDSSSAGGFVNTAFDYDEDSLDNTVTYARWINRISDRQDDSEIELSVKQRNKDIVAELNEAFKACSTKEVLDSDDHDDEEGDNDGDSDTELDIYERPSAGISRRVMLRALSGQQQESGEACSDSQCPYNQWLYEGREFPEFKLLKKWEAELRRQYEQSTSLDVELSPTKLESLDPRSLARLVWARGRGHERTPSSSQRSPSFSYFQFPSVRTPTSASRPQLSPTSSASSHLPPYPWSVYDSPSTLSSSYPIVTLPRSQRRKSKERKSLFSNIFSTKSPDLPCPDSALKPRRPPSSGSCSCSSNTSCSTCSSCYDMAEVPAVSISQFPFIRDSIAAKTGGGTSLAMLRWLPRCDLSCYVVTSLVLLGLAATAALFVYFTLFASPPGYNPL